MSRPKYLDFSIPMISAGAVQARVTVAAALQGTGRPRKRNHFEQDGKSPIAVGIKTGGR
jgi:hypothetical protein